MEASAASDHTPFHISLHGPVRTRKRRGFRFEASWAEEEGCKWVIQQVWCEKGHRRNGWQNVLSKLEKCKKELVTW